MQVFVNQKGRSVRLSKGERDKIEAVLFVCDELATHDTEASVAAKALRNVAIRYAPSKASQGTLPLVDDVDDDTLVEREESVLDVRS